MLERTREGDVEIVRMSAGENRFNPDFLDALEPILDEVEAADGPRAVVFTGEGKFFSNGLDLEWMGSAPEGGAQELAERVCRLLARVLEFPRLVVSAINGHCFAAGAMLALAGDFRVMRADRGFFSLPEADINIPFTLGMSRLITARLSPAAAHEAMVSARRFGGADAEAAGIVDRAVEEDRVLAEAIEMAAARAHADPATVAAIKRGIYSEALSALRLPLAEQTT